MGRRGIDGGLFARRRRKRIARKAVDVIDGVLGVALAREEGQMVIGASREKELDRLAAQLADLLAAAMGMPVERKDQQTESEVTSEAT